MSLFTLDITLYCRECFFNVISRKKISLHQLKLYYLCSSISESLAFNQISRMSYAIRVTELTQVLLVISQWSNVTGQQYGSIKHSTLQMSCFVTLSELIVWLLSELFPIGWLYFNRRHFWAEKKQNKMLLAAFHRSLSLLAREDTVWLAYFSVFLHDTVGI